MTNKKTEAVYSEQIIEEYKGNPLIESLPDIYSNKEVVEKLATYPFFKDEERYHEKHIRLHIIQRIFEFFQPLPRHIELEQTIGRLIRQGYVSRNPLAKEYVEVLNEGYNEIKYGIKNDYSYNATANSLTLVGVSGMGKTTVINKILTSIPQVISHSSYKVYDMCYTQIVWMELDCPYDGSLKALCLDFFSKVDELVGSNYFNKYYNSRLSANAMLPIIKQIALNVNIGVLVVDEIQHLSTARSGGAEKMLNFFVTLINTVSIPVILIGTPKALPLFQTEFRQARRSCGQGNVFWDRLKNDEEFFILVEGLWEYQWIQKPQELTKEIVDILYDESQGIIDIVVKLFFMAQIRAIISNKEEISIKLIKKVADENLKLLKPMLNSLKSGDIREIANYSDIMPIDISKVIQTAQTKLEFDNKVEELKKARESIKENNQIHMKEQVSIKLLELGYKENEFNGFIEDILCVKESNVNKLVRIAIEIINGNKNDGIKETKVKNKLLKEDDIRFLGKVAKEGKFTVYEQLKEIGYIKNLGKWLKEVSK
ncbi:MAG: ATP-binding protein [Clostridium sp.]|uniref:AAA family ATPase n=1 Tax=Clostridium sp. TaxID=1506 RepID=UPI0025C3E517|nr:ATP-binding protein [Clostridium sp.]MCE5221179.1 ATP-binding protein [Clostridium sp.]